MGTTILIFSTAYKYLKAGPFRVLFVTSKGLGDIPYMSQICLMVPEELFYFRVLPSCKVIWTYKDDGPYNTSSYVKLIDKLCFRGFRLFLFALWLIVSLESKKSINIVLLFSRSLVWFSLASLYIYWYYKIIIIYVTYLSKLNKIIQFR